MIFLAHNAMELAQLAKGIGLGVWSAIEQFHSTGSGSAGSHV
jgi:hypothetical protein